jgi:hypothetical protein
MDQVAKLPQQKAETPVPPMPSRAEHVCSLEYEQRRAERMGMTESHNDNGDKPTVISGPRSWGKKR